MKRNRIAIILVIILGSLSFWFIVNKRKGTIKETLRDFAVSDTAAIDKIFLADKSGDAVTLERNPNGTTWSVNGKYTARIDGIQTLLTTIKKIDIKEPVGKKAQDNVVKQLAADAVRCEIYSKGELIKAYYVGSHTQDMRGTYMILMDLETMKPSAKPFVTYIPGFEGYLSTRYFTKEKMWRDRSIFQYVPTDIASVKLEVPDKPELGYEVKVKGNNDYEVTMLSGKKLSDIDPLAVKQYLSYFQQVNFESLDMAMTEKEIDSTLKSRPINILTVTDTKGKVNKVKFFARKTKKEGILDTEGKPLEYDIDRMNALVESTNDFVLVQYYVFGKMMPPADYFSKKSTSSENKPKS
ncbi:MAG: hypothetical protein K0S44_360 [Bacteroidetes bacterium]|jgi:hypothetical protein|nr:hypothetical protein [Bacteroidota bacterium]